MVHTLKFPEGDPRSGSRARASYPARRRFLSKPLPVDYTLFRAVLRPLNICSPPGRANSQLPFCIEKSLTPSCIDTTWGEKITPRSY